jgi:hypothetical protein
MGGAHVTKRRRDAPACPARLTPGAWKDLICLGPGASIDFPVLKKWAVSSAVEHCFHTAGATGSIPVPPTIQKRRRNKDLGSFLDRCCFLNGHS